LRYMWPKTGLPAGVSIEDYDFVVLDYVHIAADGGTPPNAAAMSVLYKRGVSDVDYGSTPASGGGATNGTLATTAIGGSLPRFALKNAWHDARTAGTFAYPATAGYDSGIALQRGNGGGGTTKFLKATFSKGIRFNITFSDPEGGQTFAPITAVQGVAILTLPTPAAREGYKFSGWATNTGTVYSNTTAMPGNDLALTAGWVVQVPAAPITVDFTGMTFTGTGTGGTALANGSGYTFGNTNYGQYVAFNVTLPNNLPLSNYDRIAFTIGPNTDDYEFVADGQGAAAPPSSWGDTRYKSVYVLGGKPVSASTTTNNVTTYTGQPQNVTETNAGQTYNLVFTIDKTKALTSETMIGEVEFAIVINNAASSYKVTNFRIYQD